MKAKLLFFYLITNLSLVAQIPTTDLVKEYLFTGGSLQNTTSAGGSLIATGTARTLINDPLGQANAAVQLNGDGFDAGTRGSTNTKVVSLSFWMNTTYNDPGTTEIVRQLETGTYIGNSGNTQSTRYGWGINLRNGNIELINTFLASSTGTNTSGTMRFITGAITSNFIADGKWHHIVVMLEPITVASEPADYVKFSIYVDGIASNVKNIKGPDNFNANNFILNPPSAKLYIAQKEAGVNGDVYSEGIDNFRVYNKALTQQEIQILKKELASTSISYVASDATGDNSGTSWANAYTNLHAALADNNNEIWVKEGTYKPHATVRTTAFAITKDKKIYGGFSGTETNLEDRDIKANPTIFSGDLKDNDAGVFQHSNALRSENSLHVFTISTGVTNILFDGITITGGHANNSGGHLTPDDGIKGAAIFKSADASTNIIIKNSIIRENSGRLTAGIHATFNTNGSLTIENCEFKNNSSSYGTALYCEGKNTAKATVNVYNSLFTNNHSTNVSVFIRGQGGSAGLIRTNDNSNITANFVNNTYAKEINSGTQYVAASRGILGVGKISATSVLNVNVHNSVFKTGTAGVPAVNVIGNTDMRPNSVRIENNIAFNDSFSMATVRNNNINASPDFTDEANNDFTLKSTSPAINSGDNSKLPVEIITDFIGNTRIHDTTVDIGAYEFGALVYIPRSLIINATNGTVTTNPNSATGTFGNGASVTLTAIPATGYKFDGWSGDATGTTNPLTITMNVDKTITAMFSAITASVVDEEFNREVKIYPIPTSDVLNIEVTTGYDIKKVILYSIFGKRVLETEEKKMNLSSLVSGIYILKVTNSEGRIASRRIIKK